MNDTTTAEGYRVKQANSEAFAVDTPTMGVGIELGVAAAAVVIADMAAGSSLSAAKPASIIAAIEHEAEASRQRVRDANETLSSGEMPALHSDNVVVLQRPPAAADPTAPGPNT